MRHTVELRELRVFLTLAEELHFGRTAKRLGIDRSRVSQVIRTLEARIGGSLFTRSSRRVALMPLGVRLRAAVQPAYEELESAWRDAHAGVRKPVADAAWTTVELRELRAFLTVAEHLHFGRAADLLRLDRSRVSQLIRRLELKHRGPLFERTSRRVRLTPTGARLLASAGPAYAELERACEDAREAATGIAGTLRVGAYLRVNCGPRWLEIVQTFKDQHPSCDVELVNTGFDRNYVEELRNGRVDMFVSRLPLNAPDIVVGPILSRERRVLLIAEHDPLAERASISYDDIGDRAVSDVPAFPRETMDAFVPPVTPSGRRLRRIANLDVEEAIMRVAMGEQVHPTVPSFLRYINQDGIVAVPISDLPLSETALVWLASNRSTKPRAFAQAAAR